MCHQRLALQQEVIVLVIVARSFVVLTGESLDGFDRVPQRGQDEVRHAINGMTEHDHAAVAGCRLDIPDPRAVKKPLVRIALGGGDATMPGARDHAWLRARPSQNPGTPPLGTEFPSTRSRSSTSLAALDRSGSSAGS